MRAIARQANHGVRLAWFRLHGIGQVLLVLLLLPLVAAAALVWRLDQGPIAVPWLAHRIETAAAKRGVALRIGAAQVAWAGFSSGTDAPLLLILSDVAAPALKASAERMQAGFAVGRLLRADWMPASLDVTGLRAQVARGRDGSLTIPGLPQARPGKPGGTAPDWRALHALHLHDVRIQGQDVPAGVAWTLAPAEADLDRSESGGFTGQATATLAAGNQSVTLTATARPQGDGSTLKAHATTLNPSAIAALSPMFAAGSALDLPVTLSASAQLGPDLAWKSAHLDAILGGGTLHLGNGTAPLSGGTIQADAQPGRADATLALTTAARPDAAPTHIALTMHATHAGRAWSVPMAATLDQVAFADLPALWPQGVGGAGARRWVTGNIPSGLAQDGHATLTLKVADDFSDASATAINAQVEGHDLTVWWLRPVPPIVHGEATLTVTDPTALAIAVHSGAQSTGQASGVAVAYSNGLVRITDLDQKDQAADITTDLAGPVQALLAVLKNPRLRLLSKRPVPLNDPRGSFTAHLQVQHLLLRGDVSMDDVHIATTAHFTGLHLGGIAGGRDLDDGDLHMQADNDGLHTEGTATLAGIRSSLKASMDFRAGSPSDVTEDVTVAGTADDESLARAGLDTAGVLRGKLALQAHLRSRRSGLSDVTAQADATQAAVTLKQVGYDKPAGKPLHASVALQIDHDRLTAIDHVSITGYDISVIGAADVADGRPNLIRFDSLALGAQTRAHGTMRLPTRKGDPYILTLTGPTLDASGPIDSGSHTEQRTDRGDAGTPFVADVHFDRVLLGHGRQVLDAAAHAESNGRLIQSARLSGLAQSQDVPRGQAAQPFRVTLAPEPGGRRLVAQAPDAGGLLRVLGVADDIRGGAMNIGAHFDDTKPDHPLSGTAQLTGFRVLDAPAIGRVLQGVTLYGLIEVLRGPGLSFLRATVPFRWQGDVLALDGGRAYSASLGLTARGSVNLKANTLDLTGTVVPFYMLNTLPGRIPLIGKLFSPEKSGGLFAATFSVRGAMADPHVSVNPFAAIAPGILRNLFKLF